ncbi:hypothetical protein FLA_2928 [Filimonas lacunae]|nr:hypothetical protein FLA_2928 [Filimonas lacunae]
MLVTGASAYISKKEEACNNISEPYYICDFYREWWSKVALSFCAPK